MVMLKPPWNRWMGARRRPAIEWFDATVGDPTSSRNYSTLAAAEAALTAPFVVVVKQGTYAGTTLAKAGLWIFDPGCIINTTALTVSGNKVGVILGAGCDVQVNYTHSGTDGYVEMRNGVAFVNLGAYGVGANGARLFITGGGWGSIFSDGSSSGDIGLSGGDSIAMNFAGTGSNGLHTISSGARAVASGIKSSATSRFFYTHSGGVDTLVLGCLSTGAWLANEGTDRIRQIANYSASASSFNAGEDDFAAIGNVMPGGYGSLNATADNHVVVGNRLDGAPTDSAGTSTIDANDLESF